MQREKNQQVTPSSPRSRTRSPATFHVMLKPREAVCNLDCAYCFYLAKERLYPGAGFHMSETLLEAYTRHHIAAQRGPEVTFAWLGGEPTLMGVDFFPRAVQLQQQYRKPGTKVRNTLQTNGTSWTMSGAPTSAPSWNRTTSPASRRAQG